MTTYAKIENGQLITAYNGYNGIIGLADNIDLMTANGFIAYDEELISKYFSGQLEIKDNTLVDISDTPEYIKSQRLIQIDTELSQASIDYSTAMDTAVIYPVNGKSYKPSYAGDNYSWFFQAENISKAIDPTSTIFPVFIKDSTKLNENGVNMSIAELTQLTAFLAQICDNLWTIKSNKENDLLTEKATLQGE